jgi:hypothetical protein
LGITLIIASLVGVVLISVPLGGVALVGITLVNIGLAATSALSTLAAAAEVPEVSAAAKTAAAAGPSTSGCGGFEVVSIFPEVHPVLAAIDRHPERSVCGSDIQHALLSAGFGDRAAGSIVGIGDLRANGSSAVALID